MYGEHFQWCDAYKKQVAHAVKSGSGIKINQRSENNPIHN